MPTKSKTPSRKQFDLFLSHNSADKPWTERLASVVESDRTGPPLKVFFDKWDIPHGADIPLELEQGLQNSRHVGLVLSPESLASDWVVLERSTAIFRDPAARQRSLIPLMRRVCKLPDMLARLKYLDFRRDQDFEEGVATLVGILRGTPLPRGGETTEADIQFREDADLLRQHRLGFQRPAFSVSCVDELFLSELLEAIDAATAALNTGSLFSRSNNLLTKFDGSANYRVPEFKDAFRVRRFCLFSALLDGLFDRRLRTHGERRHNSRMSAAGTITGPLPINAVETVIDRRRVT